MIATPPLAVLRRPRQEDDSPPLAVLDALWRTPAGFGIDPALTRTVVADDGRSLHVVAGANCVGLFERSGEGTLWTPEQLRAGQAVTARVVGPARVLMQGLVDERVTAVRVRLRDGAHVRIAQFDGVYDVVLECPHDGDLPAGLVLERDGEQVPVAFPCGSGTAQGAATSPASS